MPEQPQDCNLPRVTRPITLPGRAGRVVPEIPLRPIQPGSDLHAPALQVPVPSAAPPKLRRSWFGLSPAAAQKLLSDQARELQTRAQAVQSELQTERARQEELTDEIRRSRSRLEALQADVEMLRATLAQEQERQPVTAEVAARQLAALRQAHETRLQDLRFEAIRLEAELQRRETQVLLIAAELYRVASNNGQLPMGLKVRMPEPEPEAPPPPPPQPPQEPGAPSSAADRNRLLIGKRLRRPIVAPDGRVIGASGDAISDAMIAAAEEHGLVAEMIGGLALPDES